MRIPLSIALAYASTACLPSFDSLVANSTDGGSHDGAEDASDASVIDAPVTDAPITDAPITQPDAPGSDATTCPVVENNTGTCNNLSPVGSIVQPLCASGEPPQPQGGPIEDGVYVLTRATIYGWCPTFISSTSNIWVICGDRWDNAAVDTNQDGGLTPTQQDNYLVSVQGASIGFAQFCRAPFDDGGTLQPVTTVGYSAAPGHLTFFEAVANGQVIQFDHVKQ